MCLRFSEPDEWSIQNAIQNEMHIVQNRILHHGLQSTVIRALVFQIWRILALHFGELRGRFRFGNEEERTFFFLFLFLVMLRFESNALFNCFYWKKKGWNDGIILVNFNFKQYFFVDDVIIVIILLFFQWSWR